MSRTSILAVLALAGFAGACRSSFRLRIPPTHPAHPEFAAARPILVPDPFTVMLDETVPESGEMAPAEGAGDGHSMHGGEH
ncbi:MAG: hypothetical protein WD226_01005 [Planctomycetota bacterium]